MHRTEKTAKLIEVISRRASGLVVRDEEIRYLFPYRSVIVIKALERIASSVVEARGNLLFCRLCGKGGFNKRGMYFHLSRMHGKEVINMLYDSLYSVERLIDLTAKLASEMRVEIKSERTKELVKSVSLLLTERQGEVFYCKLCNRRFSRKGIYMHLKRKHRLEIKQMLEKNKINLTLDQK